MPEPSDVDLAAMKPFAQVDSVASGSPADSAGLLVGDLISTFGMRYYVTHITISPHLTVSLSIAYLLYIIAGLLMGDLISSFAMQYVTHIVISLLINRLFILYHDVVWDLFLHKLIRIYIARLKNSSVPQNYDFNCDFIIIRITNDYLM